MIAFWIAAAGLSAVVAGLVLRGAAQRPAVDDAQTRLEPHRRRLAEVERLAIDGLLAEAELKAARAEAGRGLLPPPTRPKAGAATGLARARSWSPCRRGLRRWPSASMSLSAVPTCPTSPTPSASPSGRRPTVQLEPEKIAAVLEASPPAGPPRPNRWCSWPRPAPWPAT
jgi:cytochrome c-type biogenesis protein CcmH